MIKFFLFILLCLAIMFFIADYLKKDCEKDENFSFFCGSNYENLIEECKKDQVTLKWVFTLDEKFKRFFESKDYISAVPYEEFKFDVPTE